MADVYPELVLYHLRYIMYCLMKAVCSLELIICPIPFPPVQLRSFSLLNLAACRQRVAHVSHKVKVGRRYSVLNGPSVNASTKVYTKASKCA